MPEKTRSETNNLSYMKTNTYDGIKKLTGFILRDERHDIS